MSDATATGLYAQMELAPGTLLAGRFRIESLIGVGGMGVVYRALDEALGVPVAVKLLRPEMASRPDAFERFRQELLLARQVSSPHVVRIHDIARHEFTPGDARWLISMDLVDGEPLDRRLDRGALPVDEALEIARQVAIGLQAAHASGVVHRDLKPANVLIDAAGRAYVSDFGVARSVASGTRGATGGIVGTPDYLSPEQARGDPVGPRSDLYALGLILHEMLTGERAFASATAAEALAQRLVRTPELVTRTRPEVPAWVARLVERLLRPQPSHRLPDAAAVVQAIERREVPRDTAPRHLPALLLAGVAALAAVAGGTWWWTQRPDAAAVDAPAPSRPLERLLVMPLQAGGLDDAQRVGLELHLRSALENVPGLVTVDTDRTLQAMRQLGTSGEPAADALRLAGAASRVLRLELRRAGNGWKATANLLEDGRTRPLEGPPAPTPADALQGWLAGTPVRQGLGLRAQPVLRVPSAPLLEAEGKAEVARRNGRLDVAMTTLREASAADRSDPLAWLALADVAQAVGDREAALAAVEQAQRAAPKDAARLQRRLQAERAVLEGDAAAAIGHWRNLLEQAPADTWAQLQLARAHGADGDFANAIAMLQKLTDRDAQDARAWFELGKFSILQGDARRAVDDYLLRALVLFKRSRNTYGEAEAANALGIGYGRLGQTADAEEQYRRAAVLRRALGNRRGVATSLRNLANVLGQRGAFGEAAASLEEARRLYVELGDRVGLAALDNERGLLFEERGDYRASLDAFRLALQGWERAGDAYGVAQALNNIGFAHYQLGAYEDAQTYWQRASDSYAKLGDRTGAVRTGQNLGLLDAARGRWEDAQQRQAGALRQALSQQMTEEAAVGHRNLAELAVMRGDVATALAQAGRALALFGERKDLRGGIDARLLRVEALIAAGALAQATTELTAIDRDIAKASTEQRAIAGRLAAELALAGKGTHGAETALRSARPHAAASGVRLLQLQLDLLQARATGRDVAALDAPTAALGHATLRLDWLEAALTAAIQRGDTSRAVGLYREARGWMQGIHTPRVAHLHRLGAVAWRAAGDEPAARDADADAKAAQDLLRAAIPKALQSKELEKAP